MSGADNAIMRTMYILYIELFYLRTIDVQCLQASFVKDAVDGGWGANERNLLETKWNVATHTRTTVSLYVGICFSP